jgi:glycosyltransferase involved in cell wall biosynthesis
MIDIATYDIDPLLPKVLFVGRLVKRKNLPILVEAIKILERERAFSCQLVICGDGDEKPALMELARQMGNFHRILFIGFRPDVFRFMKSCDVFVLPSIMEGMPNALFEAMVARVPVIVSDIPEHRKWIEDGQNGYLFDPKDARELADKIHLSILDRDQSKENLMGKAYDLASKFTIERMAHCYEDLYKRMASELNR